MKTSSKLGLSLVLCFLVAWLDRQAIALTLPAIQAELDLDPRRMGWIISAFFLGYAAFQLPGGLLADRFGPRKVILGALVWWSVFTAVTGAAWSLTTMLVARFLFGLGEGAFPGAMWKVISQWFTKKNRATANAAVLSSIAIGPALSPFILVPLIGWFGWRGAYFAIGLLGVLCVALAARYVHNSIHEGRGVTREEIAEFEAEASSAAANLEVTGPQTRFADILRTPLVWVLFGVGLIGNIGMYGWLTWMPSFLKNTHGLEGYEYMVASAVPWAAAAFGCLLGGVVSDRWFRGRRKYLVMICQAAGVGSLYVFTRMQGSHLAVSMVFQAIAGFAFFMGTAAIWSLPMNLLPARLMGAASGLINTGGQVGGILSGIVIGAYIEAQQGDYARMWDVVIATGLINVLLVFLGIWERRAPRLEPGAPTVSPATQTTGLRY